MTDIPPCQKDQQITSIAEAVVKLKELRESNKNLNEPDIEERFARLALAFKTDKFTLGRRMDLQLRHRDTAEQNIESELRSLRKSLNALNQLCTETDMREMITKTQQHVDILQKATLSMSRQAETYGAIEQEKRMNCAFETMLNYVEHLKLLYDKEHLELEEYRRLLAEHNLLPGADRPDCDESRARTSLPPRSHSLSSSSKPEFLRRCSLSAFIRPPHSDPHKATAVISRENSSGHLMVPNPNVNVSRQKLDSRTRLLSSVCLLSNYEPPRTPTNGQSSGAPQPGSSSPKNRRSSLPVGPTSSYSQGTQPPARSHSSISESTEDKHRKSPADSSTISQSESGSPTSGKKESDDVDEMNADDSPAVKDSSPLSYPVSCLSPPDPEGAANMSCTTCNSDSAEICVLPEITILVNPKPIGLLNLVQWTSVHRIWQWDNATLLLHARYTLSLMLATAAMLTFVLTFVPNQVLAGRTDHPDE